VEIIKVFTLFGISFNSALNKIPKKKLRLIEVFCYNKNCFGKLYFRKYYFAQLFLRRLGTYRGRRLVLGLPIHGQRTHTNAKSAKKALIKLK
jgi:ribosomal protein S13